MRPIRSTWARVLLKDVERSSVRVGAGVLMKLNTYPGFGFQKLTESARTMPLFYLLPTMKRQEPKLIDAQDPRSRMVQESHDLFFYGPAKGPVI
jgi:hypothetical protein